MSLESDFKSLFSNMKSNPQDYTDVQFYTTIADKIKTYVSTLSFSASSVAGTDTSPSGAFTGSASGTLSITGSTIKAQLKTACDKGFNMTDTDLANAFGNGLQGDTVSFSVTITGKTVTTSSPPQTISPITDSGVVTAVFSSSRIKSKLIALFNNMKNSPQTYNDDSFAEELAAEVEYYYTHPTSCVVKGSSHLSGSVGNGTIS